ncbi:hypothetical protein HY498_05895 [Candidatus Woesearchaeota archaeon]|nr:hypothetical protein [Candidatus Woesearchaeota archaeon]
MGYITIAPISTNIDPIYIGIKEFSTERIILLCNNEYSNEANKIKEDLKKI